jgi:glutathione peroxidase
MRTPLTLPLAAALLLPLAGCGLGGPPQWVEKEGGDAAASAPSLYDLETRTLEGETVSLAGYKGQVALVVNVASRCGFTSQYAAMQDLHEELAPRGFTVLGFPSNDFMNQEPGNAAEIREFCTANFGVSFPLFEKRIVSGDDQDEVFQLLSRDLEEPTWNFTKYLVDREGRVLARFSPKTPPDDPELRAAIEELLES